MYLRQSVTLG